MIDVGAPLDDDDELLPAAPEPLRWAALRQSPRRDVDLLLVLSTNPDALAAQRALVTGLPSLLTALARTREPLHLHLGVVTADLGAGPATVAGCRPGGDGARLVRLGAHATPDCRPLTGTMRFIDYDLATGQHNLPPGQDLRTTLACMTAVGTGGCAFDQPLEAARQVLAGRLADNRYFHRPDALLVVDFAGAGDDCSAPADSPLWSAPEGEAGPLTPYRCTRLGLRCGPAPPPLGASSGPLDGCVPSDEGPLASVAGFRRLLGRTAATGGLKLDPNDVVLLAVGGPTTPLITDELPGGGAVVRPSCATAGDPDLAARPSPRLAAVAEGIVPGFVPAACDADWSPLLASLARTASARARATGCLPAAPADPATPACVVEDLVGDIDEATRTTRIPPCPVAGPRPTACWHLRPDDACAPVEDARGARHRLRLVVERTTEPPTRVQVRARCLTHDPS